MRILLALAALSLTAPVVAQTNVATATSPSGTLTLTVTTNGEGRVGYAVARGQTPVIGESHLGFLFSDSRQMLRNMELKAKTEAKVDSTWEQPWGEWRQVRDHHNEVALTFQEKDKLRRTMRVRFRLFDDAVAFRYELPEQENLKTANIVEELTQFRVLGTGRAWWAPAYESNREEYLYNDTPITGVGTAQTPFTIRRDDGIHVAIHEASLVDYSGMNVAHVQGGLMKADLTPSSSGPKVVRDTPFETPWRVILIAPDAPSLYHANKEILNLNEPNKLGDVSWVKPQKYVGVWWGMHLDTQTWASGPKHGATTAYTRKMIDFAAKHGFRGVLVEGWNKGWDGDWFATGDDFSFTEPYPDYDIKSLAAYGKRKGVHIIGHHETSANIANYERQLGSAMDYARSMNMEAIKTGYVSDAGGVQALDANGRKVFEWHEGQVMSRHHLNVVTEAAKRRIAINPHEPIKDTGLRRTYPNWVSREGQRGMEYNAWGDPKNPPRYDTELLFTRLLAGPMDFTPGILSLMGRGDTPIPSTLARQLAYYVTVASPIQMAADLPENYEKNPGPFQFIKDVAVDWDDTRMLAGEVGGYGVIARKERGAPTWFLGGITNEEGRDLNLPLTFLEAGKRYRAEIYRDGEGADFRTNPRAIAIEKRTVTAADRMAVRMAPGGGFAVRFVRLGR
ncbi:alpha-glucosidase [Sphingomonas kaistensis]|uniref:Alpha-glucosidase n=1 Tax=Sphingomonas kaistensis TaxID=298708 RepID=A0A7X5Y497_9SPHN|nr:glycoside hydrolase family 97 protein [Sphingomonas kaistensis]NJC04277.1 alpha-glucosidase [Sphingomonas kaistensis]